MNTRAGTGHPSQQETRDNDQPSAGNRAAAGRGRTTSSPRTRRTCGTRSSRGGRRCAPSTTRAPPSSRVTSRWRTAWPSAARPAPSPTRLTKLLTRASETGITRGTAAARLTALFYEARFSSHPLDRSQRDAAAHAPVALGGGRGHRHRVAGGAAPGPARPCCGWWRRARLSPRPASSCPRWRGTGERSESPDAAHYRVVKTRFHYKPRLLGGDGLRAGGAGGKMGVHVEHGRAEADG